MVGFGGFDLTDHSYMLFLDFGVSRLRPPYPRAILKALCVSRRWSTDTRRQSICGIVTLLKRRYRATVVVLTVITGL